MVDFLTCHIEPSITKMTIAAAELFWPCFWPLSRGKYLSFRKSRTRGRSFKKWKSISDKDKNDYNYILFAYIFYQEDARCAGTS